MASWRPLLSLPGPPVQDEETAYPPVDLPVFCCSACAPRAHTRTKPVKINVVLFFAVTFRDKTYLSRQIISRPKASPDGRLIIT